MKCSNPKCDQILDPSWQICPACLTKVTRSTSKIPLYVVGEGRLGEELNIEEFYRIPGHDNGIPYTAISQKMFYGRRAVPKHWGLVLYYSDGRKYLTEPSGFLTREKTAGLSGIHWLPKDHLSSLEREPSKGLTNPSRPSNNQAQSPYLFDCVDGRNLRAADSFFKCSECDGFCHEENRASHPYGKRVALCSVCGESSLASLWKKKKTEDRKRAERKKQRRMLEDKRRKAEEEKRKKVKAKRRKAAEEKRKKAEVERLRKEAEAEKTRHGHVEVIDLRYDIKIEMIYLKGEDFYMGSESLENAQPMHRVKVKDFLIGKFPVTQEQFTCITGNNPSQQKGSNFPVENVSWHAAKDFCKKISRLTGRTFRLPTEAEWEFACRAGSQKMYCFGESDKKLAQYAWFYENSRQQTHLVGKKKPNDWGIYDMHGNVFEWCEDWYSKRYRKTPKINPCGPRSGVFRLRRGGCWSNSDVKCSSASRDFMDPQEKRNGSGFRVIIDLNK